MWGSRESYREKLRFVQEECDRNAWLFDNLLEESKECHDKLIELSKEREFLISVLEKYNIKKVN